MTDAGAAAPRQRLAVGEAIRLVVDAATPLPVVELGADDALVGAHGHVLAEDVVAPRALPPWDNASMDGWAVRAVDVLGAARGAPARLREVDVLPAGATPTRAVGAGETARIATGAPVPAGADCVVRIEDSQRASDGAVEIVDDRDARDARRNVRRRGEDVPEGTIALRAGTVLGPAQLALLAALGRRSARVIRHPRVAILGSGDELVPIDRADAAVPDARIVATNGLALATLAHAAGAARARDHGVVGDDAGALADAMRAALADGCDVLLTTGGVSVGERDHVREAFARVGGTLRFWRVRMRPGGPIAYGIVRAPASPGGAERVVHWLGLPGNPVSAMVTFELFARPLLLRLAGRTHVHRPLEPVVLDEPVSTAAPLTHFLRAVVRRAGDTLRARLTGPQGSGLLTSMARANALLVVPEDVRALPAGATLGALRLAPALPDGDGAGIDALVAECPL